MTFTFFVTAEKAFEKGIAAILKFGTKAIPSLTAAAPAIETVAEAILPGDAAVITAVGAASSAFLAKALVAVQGGNAIEQATTSGTLTVSATVDEVNALKALVPVASTVVTSLGLGHALATPATPAA